jgi:D-beta-D-heptose 7-phosphate kinase/D-beta-D-heptose 1-phosphate adenosyltransferase
MGMFYKSESDLLKELNKIRGKKKIVFTNGCFDLLHVGHIRYLKEASQLGEFLVVGINSDASVKTLKGPTRPIQSETDRAEILAALAAVSATVIFNESTPELLIKAVKPDILVKGGDWTVDQIVGGSFVQSYGGQVLSLQFVDGKSTTKIIEKSSK